MFKIVGILILGVIIGILFRAKIKPEIVSKVMTYVIYLLLLTLGIAVGANEAVISNLGTLGYKAVLIAISSVAGSIFFSLLIYNKLHKKSSKIK